MNGVSYLELLRLTLPEIVVALAALLTLTLDIAPAQAGDGEGSPSRRRARRLRRMRRCDLPLLTASPAVSLADGMLVAHPAHDAGANIAARSDDSHSACSATPSASPSTSANISD